jgi:hypothetical protein
MYETNINNFKGFYSGVGSRETPLHVLYLMSKLAMLFEKSGYMLSSGCAIGADAAFEDILLNPSQTAEIYVPHNRFAKKMGTTHKPHYIIPKERFGEGCSGLYREAMILIHTKRLHKGWENCKDWVMDLHNRNMFQVLGLDLMTKSKFTICYTSGGEKTYEQTHRDTGGTATAINAADVHKVEVFNLGNKKDYLRLHKFVEDYERHIDYDRLHKMVVRSDFNDQKKPYSELYKEIKAEEKKRFPQLYPENKKKNKVKIG